MLRELLAKRLENIDKVLKLHSDAKQLVLNEHLVKVRIPAIMSPSDYATSVSSAEIDFSRYFFVCPKHLFWESKVDSHKRDCAIITASNEQSMPTKAKKIGPEYAVKEFINMGEKQLACFLCGYKPNRSENDQAALIDLLYHYMVAHRNQFTFKLGYYCEYQPEKRVASGKRSFSSRSHHNSIKIILLAELATQTDKLALLRLMRPVEASDGPAPTNRLFNVSTLVAGLLTHIKAESAAFEAVQSVMTSYHLLRQRSSSFTAQCTMAVKYANLPRHEGSTYHDPVTGVLRSIVNYDAHATIDKAREAQLLKEISEHKISQVDIDVASDAAREEIKAFMRLANESVCSDKTMTAADRGSQAMTDLVNRYSKYVRHRKTKVEAEQRLYENILLAHMLNLFNANLLTAEETRKHLVKFREDI